MKSGSIRGLGGASLIALALVLTPALAASQKKAKQSRPPAISMSGGIGSFTPAVADPRLAAVFARRDQTGSFRFTPANASPQSKAVRVAVRARSGTAAQASRSNDAQPTAAITPITPTTYNLGVAVGWKRFALSGDVARVEKDVLPGKRESAEMGVSYSGKKVGGRLKVAAERVDGSQRLVGADETYSVDVGASYSIARNLDVTGGVRYKVQQEQLRPFEDDRRDSQAVYIGTAFRF